MIPLPEIAAVVALFVLRLGIPLAIMIMVAYFLRRLDAKWEIEARQEVEAHPTAAVSLRTHTEPSPGLMPMLTARDVFGKPCWDIKNCDKPSRLRCPAFQQPETPCWLARLESIGKIPALCYTCDIYHATQPPLYLDEFERLRPEVRH